MRPFIALTFVLACAMGAPSHLGLGAVGYAGAIGGYATHGAVATQSVGAAPLATHPLQAGPVVAHPVNYVAPAAPAPYTTHEQGAGVTTVHQPASIVTKQVHYGTTDFVSGYNTVIHKPATPHLPISVPTVLRGSVAYNAPIVKEQVEIHNVQNPVLVERRVEVPYDVPVYQENIVQVPTPVHVDAPYNVPVPTPVQGETIIKRTQAAPVITHSNHHVNAGVVGAVGAVGAVGYNGALGYAGAVGGYAHHGAVAGALIH